MMCDQAQLCKALFSCPFSRPFSQLARAPKILQILFSVFWLLIFAAPPTALSAAVLSEDDISRGREKMLTTIRLYGMRDERVLSVMARVPRHLFVPPKYQKLSFEDSPLPIGFGQTISQPFIVSEMTRLLQLDSKSKVLEIGSGSGFQAAVLSEFTHAVFSMEIIPELHKLAGQNLHHAGYENVQLRQGDGYFGWPEEAPFSAIIVTCAAGHIPPPLLEQLAAGGRMLIPVGKRLGTQFLIMVEKDVNGIITSRTLMPVSFVPLVRK